MPPTHMQEQVREHVPEPAVQESGAGSGAGTATGGQEQGTGAGRDRSRNKAQSQDPLQEQEVAGNKEQVQDRFLILLVVLLLLFLRFLPCYCSYSCYCCSCCCSKTFPSNMAWPSLAPAVAPSQKAFFQSQQCGCSHTPIGRRISALVAASWIACIPSLCPRMCAPVHHPPRPCSSALPHG